MARAASPAGFQDALALYNGAHYSEARAIFGQLAAGHPDDPVLNFYLGRLALWFDDDATGLACLEKAAWTLPRNARIQNALGDAYGMAAQKAPIYSKFGWAMKCKAAYERAVELEPRNPDYHWSLMGYFQLAPRIAGGGFDKAYAEAERIRALDPVGGRVAFATVCLADGKPERAFAPFDEVLRRTPDDFTALYNIGRCAAISGEQLDRGLASLKRCLRLPVPPGTGKPKIVNVHYRMGNILEKKGDRAGAAIEYGIARRIDPDFRPDKETLKK